MNSRVKYKVYLLAQDARVNIKYLLSMASEKLSRPLDLDISVDANLFCAWFARLALSPLQLSMAM